MEIKVINQRKFQFLENHKIILELYYPRWWSNNAEIRYLGKQFKIKAKGFWQNTFIILKNGLEIGSIKLNWKQDSVISLKAKSKTEKNYHLYQESFWHTKFVVKANESSVLRIHAKRNWKKFYPILGCSTHNFKLIWLRALNF